MERSVIVAGVRTPVGAYGGTLAELSAPQLGAHVVAEALRRAGVPADAVDEVILGNVLQAGVGQNCARQAAIAAGLPVTVPAMTVNKVCGSGLKSVALAAQAIAVGDAEVVVAGGTESMSRAPYLLERARFGYRMGDGQLVDAMLRDGLWCALEDCHMGVTAENVAREQEVARADQDAFAARSQARAAAALAAGRFTAEIAPVPIPRRKETVLVDTDEHPRPDSTAERLATLRPAFDREGSVTAGNASGLNDGAAAVVVVAEGRAAAEGLTPMATIRGWASAGVAPRVMGLGPIPAIRRVLERTGLGLGDIDLFE
ncbi:MAG TPA: acetyl-CoA C-acyltransferase, partial [Candidatus Dormibacteraeota bacterium]|nr:acetyl-CoA C-acyltransferase [Candidatus Dormibacteraeota bacterium]